MAEEEKLKLGKGVAFVKGMVDDVLDELIELSQEQLVQSLVQSINLQVLDELKRDSTSVKRWRTGGTAPLPPAERGPAG